eukprot:195802-Chlamydomonas_euryale.AAC.2
MRTAAVAAATAAAITAADAGARFVATRRRRRCAVVRICHAGVRRAPRWPLRWRRHCQLRRAPDEHVCVVLGLAGLAADAARAATARISAGQLRVEVGDAHGPMALQQQLQAARLPAVAHVGRRQLLAVGLQGGFGGAGKGVGIVCA